MTKRFALEIELNLKKYSYIALTFLFGFLLGAFVLYFSKKDNLSSVSSLMTGLFITFEKGNVSSFNILAKTFLSHLKTLAVFIFANVTGASFFIVTVICVMAGYTAGYSICSLFMLYGIKAIFIVLFAVVPAKIFVMSGYALLFASSLDKNNPSQSLKHRAFTNQKPATANYFISLMLIFAGILADSFFAPLVLRLFTGLFL